MSTDLVILALIALVFFLPWILFCCLPQSFIGRPRIRAIAFLFALLCSMTVIEVIQPRFSNHFPFGPLDYGLMCMVPLAAFIAGRFASHFSHTFTFGAICATLFTSIYHSDTFGLAWEIDLGHTSVNQLIAQWLLITLSTGLACWLIALLAACTRKKPLPAFPPLCPTCAYDLRAHSPGNKCPECGTPISDRPNSSS